MSDPITGYVTACIRCGRCGQVTKDFVIMGDGFTCNSCANEEVYGDDDPYEPPIEDSQEALR